MGDATSRVDTLTNVRRLPADPGDAALRALRDLVVRHEDAYPGIDIWFDRQVVPDLRSGDRVAWMAGVHGCAILKRATGKICHLSLAPELRGNGMGGHLFRLCIREARRWGNRPRFTAGEALSHTLMPILTHLRFQMAGAARAYRRGDGEMVWIAA